MNILSIRAMLNGAFEAFKRDMFAWMGVAALSGFFSEIPAIIKPSMRETNPFLGIPLLFGFILMAIIVSIYLSYVMYSMAFKSLAGEEVSPDHIASTPTTDLGGYFGTAVLGTLVVFAPLCLVTMGLLIASEYMLAGTLVALFGLFCMAMLCCRYAFVIPVAVAEKRFGMKALHRSEQITLHHRWKIFWLLITFGLLGYIGLATYGVGALITTPVSVIGLVMSYLAFVGKPASVPMGKVPNVVLAEQDHR